MLDNLGGRKFLLTLIAVAVGTAVQLLSPKGVTTEFVALLIGVCGAFTAGNAFVTTRMPAAQDSGADEPKLEVSLPPADLTPVPQQVDLTPIAQQIAAIQANFEAHSQALVGLQQATMNNQKLLAAAMGLGQKAQ